MNLSCHEPTKTGPSVHGTRFAGYLGLRESFESSVRQNTMNLNLHQHQTVSQVRANSVNAIHHEHFVCGDEKSVGARLVQNVFQPVIAVGKQLNQGIEWSDPRASIQGKKQGKKDGNFVLDFVPLANENEH